MYSHNLLNFQEPTTILNACKNNLETLGKHHVYGIKQYNLIEYLAQLDCSNLSDAILMIFKQIYLTYRG